MGLMDKISATVKNADSRLGQGVDESKLKMKITEEQSKIKLNNEKIGSLYYKSLYDSSIDFAVQVKTFTDLIDTSNKIIEESRAKIDEIKEKGAKERQANKEIADNSN